MNKRYVAVLLASAIGLCLYLMSSRMSPGASRSTEVLSIKAEVKDAKIQENSFDESQKHAAKARTMITKLREKRAYFADFEREETAFAQAEVDARRLRGEALREVHWPADWDRLGPDDLAKVDLANEIEAKAHQRLVDAFNKMKEGTK